ncbi:MAG: adenylate/guanylate cyclase domain-containing protein [Gemmatimonadaceae bacterium]
MHYQLIAADGDQTFELRGEEPLVVGRALNSDIPIFDPTISRRHAEVACVDGGVSVRDLGSSNGTFVNGARIETARAASGDQVTFGKVVFRVKEVRTAEMPAASTATPITAPGLPSPAPRAGQTIVRPVPLDLGIGGFGTRMQAAVAPPPAQGADALSVRTAAERDRAQEKLARLLGVSTDLTRIFDTDELLAKIAEHCFETFEVDRMQILLLDEAGAPVPKLSRDKRGMTGGWKVPQSIVRAAVQNREAMLTEDAGEDQRFGGQSILMQQVRSAMCAPLVGGEGSPLGAIYVDNLTLKARFTADDLDFLVAFSGIAAVALENSRLAERIRHETVVRSNFERFFAPSLAARIASSPDAVRLGGDKRTVAVLFSDIRGFTAMSETMSPDEMASLLNEYFTEMVECVFRNGGTLDKFIGDAVMAQWGAPISAPDDPDRAMRAAIEMIEELDRLNAKWRAEGKPELQVGIGLNYGDAFAGNIGSERRLEFTVIGDTVNTASRLCGAAEGHQILLSEEMRRALTNPPQVVEVPPMELKNKSRPLRIYSVVP